MSAAWYMSSPVRFTAVAVSIFGFVTSAGRGAAGQAGADEVVYISSVKAADPQTGEYTDDIEVQVRQVFANLRTELSAIDRSLDDVASVNVYLKDTRHFPAMNEVYREIFHTDPPARATVQVDLPSPDALISLSVVAVDPDVGRTVVRPVDIMSPELPYSWGIRSGNTLYIAGTTSRDPQTYQPVVGDVGTQTRRVLQNVGLVLKAANMDYSDIAACRVFLDDARGFGAMNREYATFFPEAPPARATVRAGVMNPTFKVEIQCVAVQDVARRVVIADGARVGRSPFSPSIMVGDRLYLSGMLGRGPEGYGDIESQTRRTLQNLFATMASVGMDRSDVINARLYVTDIRQASTVQEVYQEVMGDLVPPTTVVGASLMSAMAGIEIMFTAQRH